MRVALDSRPEVIDQLERRKMQLQIEEISLKRESGAESADRLETVQAELELVEEQLQPLMEQYIREKVRFELN